MQIAELSFSLCNLIDSLEIYVSLHRWCSYSQCVTDGVNQQMA
jgi:hypothetical protein